MLCTGEGNLFARRPSQQAAVARPTKARADADIQRGHRGPGQA